MATLNNKSRKSVVTKPDKNELKNILKKISNSLKDLSINVALLEQYVSKEEEEHNNISDEENGFESAEENVIEPPGLVKSSLAKNPSEDSTAFSQEPALTSNYKILSVQDMKKRFELKRQQHFEKRSSESSDTQSFEIEGRTTKVEKLKKNFETTTVDSDVSDISEQINNRKVTKEVEMQGFPNEYRDKIQKVLKYFKPPQ